MSILQTVLIIEWETDSLAIDRVTSPAQLGCPNTDTLRLAIRFRELDCLLGVWEMGDVPLSEIEVILLEALKCITVEPLRMHWDQLFCPLERLFSRLKMYYGKWILWNCMSLIEGVPLTLRGSFITVLWKIIVEPLY